MSSYVQTTEELLIKASQELEDYWGPIKQKASQIVDDFNNNKISAVDAWRSLPPPWPMPDYDTTAVALPWGPQRWRYPHLTDPTRDLGQIVYKLWETRIGWGVNMNPEREDPILEKLMGNVSNLTAKLRQEKEQKPKPHSRSFPVGEYYPDSRTDTLLSQLIYEIRELRR